jgi:hypothetical protein
MNRFFFSFLMLQATDDFQEIPEGMFDEPTDFRPPSPKPTYTEFTRNAEHVKNGPLVLKVNLPPKHR